MTKQITSEDSDRVLKELEVFANEVAAKTNDFFTQQPNVGRLSSFIREISNEADAYITKYQQFQSKLNLSCKKGCCWCCSEIVLAPALEIVALFHYIQTHFGEREITELRTRLEAYEANMEPRRERPFTLVREQCPLLVNGECSAYEARPLDCRGKSSESAVICRMWTEAPGEGDIVPNFIAQKMVARAATMGLAHGQLGEPVSIVHEMNRCLKMLFDDPGLAAQIVAGIASFPSVVPGKEPFIFQVDTTSISPPLLENHPFQDAIELAKLGRFQEAESKMPPNTPLRTFVKMRAPGMYASLDQIYEYRERLSDALNELDDPDLNVLAALPPLGEHNMASLPYQGLPVREILEKQGRLFHDRIIARAYPHLCAPIEKPRKPGRFRLGYVSGALMQNNGSKWALGWLRNHSSEFETFALNLGIEDIASKMWAQEAEHYYDLHGNLQRIAEFIRNLDLDALIITDLAFRKRDYIYFSMRLARVQCTAWGVPCTSGMPNVDYYLSSEFMEPKSAQEEYTEKLVTLPRSGLCYPRPKSKYWEGKFKRPSSEFYPFMAQNIRKWTPQRDDLLKRIADRHGKPLQFIAVPEPEQVEIFSNRIRNAGIRHEMLQPTNQLGFANRLAAADVSFDPPDWSGGNTTIEALSYGIPVVTLPGQFMRSRHSMAFLKIANAEGLIAKDEEDYIDLIFNAERRRESMENLNADALFEDKGTVEALDSFLLSTL